MKPCFVIAPIGRPDTDTRRRSDKVFRHIIKLVAEEKGYEAGRSDHIEEPGLITSQVIQRVVDDPLVVADLSGRNPNVFYELALRHAIRKPFIQIMDHEEDPPFDVAPTRIIKFDINDLDSVEAAKDSMRKQIDAIHKDPHSIDSPISTAIALKSLQTGGSPQDALIPQIVAMVGDVQRTVNRMARHVAPSDELTLDDLVANRWIMDKKHAHLRRAMAGLAPRQPLDPQVLTKIIEDTIAAHESVRSVRDDEDKKDDE